MEDTPHSHTPERSGADASVGVLGGSQPQATPPPPMMHVVAQWVSIVLRLSESAPVSSIHDQD